MDALIHKLRWPLVLCSWCLITFGQPAWVSWFCLPAALFGYALFWLSTLTWSSRWQWMGSILFYASAQAVQLSWMTATDYTGPLILGVHAGLCLALGVQFAFLTYLVHSQPLTLFRAAGLSGFWVLMEWSRIFFLTGFTWNPSGLAWTSNLYSLQGASLLGIYGLSFWVMFVNFTALIALTKRTWRQLALFISCASVLFVFGAMRLYNQQESPKLAALLIQPALLPHEKDFTPERRDEMVPVLEQWRRMLSMIERAKGPFDLIVFPEASLPFAAHRNIYPMSLVERVWQEFFDELPPEPDLQSSRIHHKTHEIYVSNAYWMQALADKFQCDVIAGLDDRDEEGKQYNAAFHFKPDAAKSDRYEKRILVPVAEYIPCSHWDWVRSFIWEQYGINDSFQSGAEAKLFEGILPIGISICYEETFSSLIRELKTKGAELFVNITNDGYYPHSKLAKQHFDLGLLRSVENGVPLLRACCTGVTGGVDCFGRVIAIAPEDEPMALELSLPLQTTSTLYALLGEAAIVALSALFAMGLVVHPLMANMSLKKNSCPK